jgi:hypothetical protein
MCEWVEWGGYFWFELGCVGCRAGVYEECSLVCLVAIWRERERDGIYFAFGETVCLLKIYYEELTLFL